MYEIKRALLLLVFLLFSVSSVAQDILLPFTVDTLFDSGDRASLGLSYPAGCETITIFAPDSDDNRYNHGVVLFPFRGMIYAQWQSSAADEDAADTRVFCSRSADGCRWSVPVCLTGVTDGVIATGGGWWSYDDTLVAFINVWDVHGGRPVAIGTEYITTTDGIRWSDPQPVTAIDGTPMPGIIEQDMRALPSGRIITAFHLQPGLTVTPCYTDDHRGTAGWVRGVMPHLSSATGGVSRELEPSWFRRGDGAIVMVFRDQAGTFRKLASVSCDDGVTWTMPVLVDTPDSRAKQSAGNLPDGTAFMVNNPSGTKDRFPLVVTLSRDGFHFDRAFLLRAGGDDLQPMRYAGRYKRPGYSYPKSIVWGGYLYVSYATNKEEVELTRVPLVSLRY